MIAEANETPLVKKEHVSIHVAFMHSFIYLLKCL